MSHKKLSETSIQSRLTEIPGWSYEQGKLIRSLTFKDFVEAFGFMTRAAIISEKMDHHPDWNNVYNRVTISLWSHDCDGISERDFSWAKSVNALVAAPAKKENS